MHLDAVDAAGQARREGLGEIREPGEHAEVVGRLVGEDAAALALPRAALRAAVAVGLAAEMTWWRRARRRRSARGRLPRSAREPGGAAAPGAAGTSGQGGPPSAPPQPPSGPRPRPVRRWASRREYAGGARRRRRRSGRGRGAACRSAPPRRGRYPSARRGSGRGGPRSPGPRPPPARGPRRPRKVSATSGTACRARTSPCPRPPATPSVSAAVTPPPPDRTDAGRRDLRAGGSGSCGPGAAGGDPGHVPRPPRQGPRGRKAKCPWGPQSFGRGRGREGRA